jgi:uncharacterized protein (TIGR04255 family)
MTMTYNPLVAPAPKEIPLEYAPLVRVLTQLRFPKIASIARDDFIGPFQEAIREEYPVLRPEEGHDIFVGPEGVQSRTSKVWRFYNLDETWRVSLSPDFLALETVRYTSRDDFIGRFHRLLVALRDHINPQTIDRLGVRYIDRIHGDNCGQLNSLVRSEVAGILATELGAFAQQTINESVFRVPDEPWTMLARWGKLPAGATIDPNALEAIGSESWILDLDVFHQQSRPMDVEHLTTQTRQFAERIYTFFRWAITEEFLVRYGGEV